MKYKGMTIHPKKVHGGWRYRITKPGMCTDPTSIYKLKWRAVIAARRRVRQFLKSYPQWR